MEDKNINKIAEMLTDDPDIFNEMLGTGSIAMGPGVPMQTRKRRKRTSEDEDEDEDDIEDKPIKKFYADPVTGKPKDGEVLFSDTQGDDEEAVE